jgi:hypothetical protein
MPSPNRQNYPKDVSGWFLDELRFRRAVKRATHGDPWRFERRGISVEADPGVVRGLVTLYLYALRRRCAALFHQRLVDGFARFLNLGLAFARDYDRMGIRVMQVRDGAGDAGHLGGNDVDWPSRWQGKFL